MEILVLFLPMTPGKPALPGGPGGPAEPGGPGGPIGPGGPLPPDKKIVVCHALAAEIQ